MPYLTLRENTERPVTVSQGTNTIVGYDTERIVSEALAILDGRDKAEQVPELWDGRAASRIVNVLDLWEIRNSQGDHRLWRLPKNLSLTIVGQACPERSRRVGGGSGEVLGSPCDLPYRCIRQDRL